jgi:hypothetical protein
MNGCVAFLAGSKSIELFSFGLLRALTLFIPMPLCCCAYGTGIDFVARASRRSFHRTDGTITRNRTNGTAASGGDI